MISSRSLLILVVLALPGMAQIRLDPGNGAVTGQAGQSPQGAGGSGLAPLEDTAPASRPDAGLDARPEDLLNRLDREDPPSLKRSWVSRLKDWLGAGGAHAKRAAKAYADGDYDAALQGYTEAQLDNPESQALAFNAGNVQFKKKKYAEAINAYKKALHGDDAGLAASSYYNLGNSHFRKGEFAIQSGQQEGLEDYREAMAMYKKSLEIRPDNKDAKRNIEVTQARIKELLERQKQDEQPGNGKPQKPPEPSAEAKKVLARALQLVSERRYAEAKSLLEAIIQKDRTAVSFQAYVQRLDDISRILRGETPMPTATQDPRAQQGGVGVI